MTVQEWQAESIEGAARALAFWIEKTEADRLAWQPKAEEASNSRSVLDMAQEYIFANYNIAKMLKGETVERRPAADAPQLSGAEEAQSGLIASSKALAETIRSLSDDDLTRSYQTPFGPWPGAQLLRVPLMNMFYHGGQVNYIQRLYGDVKFEFPPQPQP